MISRSAAKKMLSKEAFEQIESDIKNGKPAQAESAKSGETASD